MTFNFDDLPRRDGATAIITGANAGLGFETTRWFALKGIHVVMACRNRERGLAAKAKLAAEVDASLLEVMDLDLCDVTSVRKFADAFRAQYQSLDLLVNNAGIMLADYAKTADGFESHMAANYWGHFLLTSLLIDTMPDTPQSRVVVLSSLAHRQGLKRIRFEDIHWDKGYTRHSAYAQTNLARLLFMHELGARLKASNRRIVTVAAHPGMSETELARSVPPVLAAVLRHTVVALLSHAPREAALPTVMAALGEGIDSGEYFGPQGLLEMSGPPGHAKQHPCARNKDEAERLWALSEELTGAKFDFFSAG